MPPRPLPRCIRRPSVPLFLLLFLQRTFAYVPDRPVSMNASTEMAFVVFQREMETERMLDYAPEAISRWVPVMRAT